LSPRAVSSELRWVLDYWIGQLMDRWLESL